MMKICGHYVYHIDNRRNAIHTNRATDQPANQHTQPDRGNLYRKTGLTPGLLGNARGCSGLMLLSVMKWSSVVIVDIVKFHAQMLENNDNIISDSTQAQEASNRIFRDALAHHSRKTEEHELPDCLTYVP